MISYKEPISTLIVIYTDDLSVLLLKRVDFPDAWQSVTGSIEKNERLRDTAIREISEETGLDFHFPVASWDLVDWELTNEYAIYEQWRHRYAPGVVTNTEHVFGLKLPHTVPITLAEDEHVDYKWVEWHVAAEMVFSPSNAQAIRLLPHRIEVLKNSVQ